MDMVFLYFDNPQMLECQIDCWNSYIGTLQTLPTVLLVDDGSTRISALQVLEKKKCQLPLKLFRVNVNIPWNFSGARNLGCSHADDWVYISDIDTMLLKDDARLFFDEPLLDTRHFYIPRRVKIDTDEELRPAIANLLFHKTKFLEIGGYDEDYAGSYGKEETDFWLRLKKVSKTVRRDDVSVRLVGTKIVADCNTHGLVRNKKYNTTIFEKKQAEGFPNPGRMLRFPWERVL